MIGGIESIWLLVKCIECQFALGSWEKGKGQSKKAYFAQTCSMQSRDRCFSFIKFFFGLWKWWKPCIYYLSQNSFVSEDGPSRQFHYKYHLWPGDLAMFEDPIAFQGCCKRWRLHLSGSKVSKQNIPLLSGRRFFRKTEANTPKNSVSTCLGMKKLEIQVTATVLNMSMTIWPSDHLTIHGLYKNSQRLPDYQWFPYLWLVQIYHGQVFSPRNAFGSLSFDSKLSEEDLWSAEKTRRSLQWMRLVVTSGVQESWFEWIPLWLPCFLFGAQNYCKNAGI